MKKYIITAIILCATIISEAQSNAAVWSKKFDAYQSTWPKTKIHLTFNQEKYFPGDTAYFKAYFLKEDLTGINGKQLINLNLVDSQGRTKLHFIFRVDNGLGYNQIAIPDTLREGIYIVTAHSSWMKNFDPMPIFQKEIKIVRKNSMVSVDKAPSLSLVAEGGHLVRDVSNKISIRTNRAGSTVQIIDATGQAIGNTTCDMQGVSSIIFKPTQNTSYFAKIAGEPVQVNLPITENDGCSLLLKCTAPNEPISMVVSAPPGSSLRNEELTIVVNGRGKIYQMTPLLLGTKEFETLHISRDDLPEGIVHVSLLQRSGRVLASRDFYCAGKSSIQADIKLAKASFHVREKVSLEVSLQGSRGEPIQGEFSISVINDALFETENQTSFSDELNIPSALNEPFRIDRSDPNWLTSLDNLLISVTEEMPWPKIISNEVVKPNFPFSNAIEKSGRAYFTHTMEPVPDFTQIMFYLQQDKERYQTVTQKNAKVALAIFDIFGMDEFFYLAQVKGEEIGAIQIKWDEELITLPRSPVFRVTEDADLYASFMAKKRAIDQSFLFYKSSDKMPFVDNTVSTDFDFEDEVAAADIVKNIQDYIVFPSVAELLKEVIPSMYHRVVNGKNMVRVQLLQPMIATNDPLYIIDGIATKNTEFFLSLNPSDLLTIKIVNDSKKLMPLGLLGKNGIVIVQTRKGDMREPLVDESKLIEGLNKPVDFKADNYDRNSNSRKPNFRSTIHWNPSIKTDSNGKAIVEFFCSDDVGKLSISIKGIASGGKPFFVNQNVNVELTVPKE